MKEFLSKLLLPLALLLLFISCLVIGIKKSQYTEVELNGNILCLSCIGIE